MPIKVGQLKDFTERLNDITEPGKKKLILPALCHQQILQHPKLPEPFAIYQEARVGHLPPEPLQSIEVKPFAVYH